MNRSLESLASPEGKVKIWLIVWDVQHFFSALAVKRGENVSSLHVCSDILKTAKQTTVYIIVQLLYNCKLQHGYMQDEVLFSQR